MYKANDGREYGYHNTPAQELKSNRDFGGEIVFRLLGCATCGVAGLAEFHNRVLYRFDPHAQVTINLPDDTPDDIKREFRSAENCSGIEEYRPGATMLRSTIEKVLIKHGYNENDLFQKLDQLAEDKIITRTLAKQNQEIVRILGNDVLHGIWREVFPDEFATAYKYTHRLIEAFYDDHKSVLAELQEIGKEIPDEESQEPESS